MRISASQDPNPNPNPHPHPYTYVYSVLVQNALLEVLKIWCVRRFSRGGEGYSDFLHTLQIARTNTRRPMGDDTYLRCGLRLATALSIATIRFFNLHLNIVYSHSAMQFMAIEGTAAVGMYNTLHCSIQYRE